MHSSTRVRAAGLALVTGIASVFIAVTPSSALADCSHGHSNRDGRSGRVSVSALWRLSGPHRTCNHLDLAYNGQLIQYHCWDFGDEVQGIRTWTYGRISGTDRAGWFWDGGLNDGGAQVAC